jgi:hypothetical protein
LKLQQIDEFLGTLALRKPSAELIFERGSSSFSEDGHFERSPRATKHRIRASASGRTDPTAHDSRHLTRRLRPPSCLSSPREPGLESVCRVSTDL